jgi:hypothetical protein
VRSDVVASDVSCPAGFIKPCLPTKAQRPPSDEAWLHEIKHDGFRVIAMPLKLRPIVTFKPFKIAKLDGHELYAALFVIGAMVVVWGGAVSILLFEWLRR